MARIFLLLLFVLGKFKSISSSDLQTFSSAFTAESLCSNSFLNATLYRNVSENCVAQLTESCVNGTVLDTLLDATSKYPYTSIRTGSKLDYGNYDQCIGVDHRYSGGRILGKHCLAGLVLADFSNLSNTNLNDLIKLSICMPDACSAKDYNTIFNETLFMGLFPGVFQDAACSTKETGNEFSTADVITITLITICVAAMIICTAYDIYLKRYQKKPGHILYLSFSIYTNGRKILQSSRFNKEQILIFNGIKFISMAWIVAGHGIIGWRQLSITNADFLENYEDLTYAFYLMGSPLAVDTFFYISGFLMAYQYLKTKSKPLRLQIMSIPQLYLHRYLRLTPAVLMIFLLNISLFSHMGSGPLWHKSIEAIQSPCKKHWWAFFLYIQNYNNYDDICYIPAWYLSADMQMFLLSPLVMIPLAIALRDSKKFKTSMICLLVLNIILTALPIFTKIQFKDYNNSYDTHSRLMIYFIGIMMGAYMREKKENPFLNSKWSLKILSIINFFLWIIILIGMFAMVVLYRDATVYYDYKREAVFLSLVRPAWGAGLSWIVYSSYHGYGGFVNWLLSRPLMQIGGKLCYSIYLVHGLVVAHNIMMVRSRLYFSDYNVFYFFCGYLILSIVASVFWTLAFESPLITVERFIFGASAQKHKKAKDEKLTK